MTERNWIEKESTLPETNIAPENRPSQKETIVFQPSIFRGYVMLVSGRVPVSLHPPFSIHFHPASTVAACRPMAAQIEVQKAMLGGPTTSQATKKRCNSDCQPVTHPLRHERSRFTMADCPIQLQNMKCCVQYAYTSNLCKSPGKCCTMNDPCTLYTSSTCCIWYF